MHWKELEVWKKAHGLVLDVYKVTSGFPRAESFGITDQLRRAAYSIPANIVEGQSRHTTKEYMQFLYNARGSVEEVRYFLLLSKDLGYLKEADYQVLEENYQTVSKDYGTKPPSHGIRSKRHCERSEAIFARKQRLLRRLPLLAMTASPPVLLCAAGVLSHGPKLLNGLLKSLRQ